MGSRDGKWLVRIRATPRDANGNLLGPGYRDHLTLEVPGFAADWPIQDELDGSYTRSFLIPASSLGAQVKVAFEQEPVYDGSVSRALLMGWLWLTVLVLILLLLLVVTIFLLRRRRHHAAGRA